MYDAEVGSSGGRCESGPWIDVGEDRVETSRRASSVAEVAMYRGSNMISKRTEAEIPLKEVHIENNNNEKHNMGKHENIGTQIRDGQQEDGRFHDRCFFLFYRRERIRVVSQKACHAAVFVYRVAVTNGCPRGIT